MAELSPEKRENLCRVHEVPCPKHGNHSLVPAPNEDMPNGNEYDFLCPCGYLFNASDVMEILLGDS